MEWHREPDPAWVHELRTLSPPSRTTSHLELWWEPGELWAPAQRWVIYQLTPIAALAATGEAGRDLVESFIWAINHDQPPCRCAIAWTRHGDRLTNCQHCGGSRSYIRERCARALWDQACYPQPWWIIQGEQGGHPYAYSSLEQKLLVHAGRPYIAPLAGHLPYAPWDSRVRRMVILRDFAQTKFANLKTAHLDQQRAAVRQARAAMDQYLGLAAQQATDEVRLDYSALPVREGPPLDINDISARFIETGDLVRNA